MIWSTFLLQIFSHISFCLKDLIEIVRLLLAAVSIIGLTLRFEDLFPGMSFLG